MMIGIGVSPSLGGVPGAAGPQPPVTSYSYQIEIGTPKQGYRTTGATYGSLISDGGAPGTTSDLWFSTTTGELRCTEDLFGTSDVIWDIGGNIVYLTRQSQGVYECTANANIAAFVLGASEVGQIVSILIQDQSVLFINQ